MNALLGVAFAMELALGLWFCFSDRPIARLAFCTAAVVFLCIAFAQGVVYPPRPPSLSIERCP